MLEQQGHSSDIDPMAFPGMAPMDIPVPGYVIYRTTPSDPTSHPVFYPAKDSDELFDALRAKYPHLKTHSERMRDAIIEFLLDEREAELSQTSSAMPSQTTETSPWQQSWPSMSSGSGSVLSSPETLDLATPTFGNSPQVQPPHLARQFSTSGSTLGNASEPSPGTPALEQMTGVFSLSSSGQPKQRVRRKMTEAEKIEYRKRRIVKACDKCAKRKRKCQHNENEMDRLAAKSQKVTKARTQASMTKSPCAAPALQQQKALIDLPAFGYENEFTADMQLFDDFTNFFDESITDFAFDASRPLDRWLSPEAGARALEHGLMHAGHSHSEGGDCLQTPDVSLESEPAAGCARTVDRVKQHRRGAQNGDVVQSAEAVDPVKAQVVPDNTTVFQGYHPHHLFSTINTRGHPSLAKIVNTLLGTRKAVNVLSNLLNSRSLPSSRSVSLGRVADLIRVQTLQLHSRLHTEQCPLDAVPQAHVGVRTHDFLRYARHRPAMTDQASRSQDTSVPTHVVDALTGWSSAQGYVNTPRHGEQLESDADGIERSWELGAPDPLEGMSISDYLRMTANFFPVEKSGRASSSAPVLLRGQKIFGYPSATLCEAGTQASDGLLAPSSPPVLCRTQKKFGYPLPAPEEAGAQTGEGSLASTSVPVSRGSPLLGGGESTAQEGRPLQRAFGESITRGTSPSTELYRLKRRIPKALHSIIDRDTPLLQVRQPILQTDVQVDRVVQRGISLDTTHTEDNILANGGAYLRLDTNTPSIGSSAIADQPAHSRSNNPRANGFSWDLYRQSPTGKEAMSAVACSPTNNVNVATSSTVCDVEVSRLCDHMRCRDHFGRSERESYKELAAVLTVLGALLLVTSMSAVAPTVDTTLVLLAILAPLPGAKGGHFRARTWRFWSPVRNAMLQFMAKNSWWLGKPPTKPSESMGCHQQQRQKTWGREMFTYAGVSQHTQQETIAEVA